MTRNSNVGILFHFKTKTKWKIVEQHSNQQLDIWQCKLHGLDHVLMSLLVFLPIDSSTVKFRMKTNVGIRFHSKPKTKWRILA